MFIFFCLSVQDSLSGIFWRRAGVCLLVPKDLLLEIRFFSFGSFSLFNQHILVIYTVGIATNHAIPWSFLSNGLLLFGVRNEKNQLLLGIRRATRPQTVMPSSVISSDSMHIGLLAAAAHAAATNSCFTVFFNPRWCWTIVCSLHFCLVLYYFCYLN